MSLRDDVVQQALSLPAEDRIFVVHALEQSLDGEILPQPEVAADWNAELIRRIESIEQGRVVPLELETAITRLRQQLADRRV